MAKPSTAENKQKYKLFSASNSETGVPPPCAFFASPDGCRNGDQCKFSHGLPAASPADTSSVVSSESECEEPPKHSAPSKTKIKTEFASKKEASHSDAIKDGALFLDQPPSNHDAPSKEKPKKKKRKSAPRDGADLFANRKHGTTTTTSSSSKTQPPPSKKRKTATSPLASTLASLPIAAPPKASSAHTANYTTPQSSFRDLDLPVASYIPQTLPNHTETGRKWQAAVETSRQHAKYSIAFDYEKAIQADISTGRATRADWIQAKPFGEWCQSNPQAIAIDCEMCETKHPTTGIVDARALCRISILNAENPTEVLLDTLVKPDWPVSDYRSRINGIGKEHLDGVAFTLKHAQAFMMALCSEETVIVGHALHNDLMALKMQHYVNVDSACLFAVKDEPNATVSLRDLTMHFQQTQMPDTHDSVNDARMALVNVVKGYLDKGGKNIDEIPRAFPPRRTNPNATSQLFVHRIPKICESEHLTSMFVAHTSIQPLSVSDIEFTGNTGKTLVTFASPRHANLAFDSLDDNKPTEDASGRLQKKVYMRGGGFVRVRKMVHEKIYNKDDKKKEGEEQK